jgi:hypothetical protein
MPAKIDMNEPNATKSVIPKANVGPLLRIIVGRKAAPEINTAQVKKDISSMIL